MAEKVVGQLVVTVDADTELAEARLKGLQSSLKSLSYLDKDLSDITIGGNFLDEALKRVTGGFMQLIQGLSASAFRGAAGVFTSIASAGYNTAKSIETAHVAFETFLGSGEEADKLLKKIRKDAMITPFDVSGLAKATQKLLMVEKNGLAAEQTIMNLGKALTAAGKGDEQLSNLTNYLQQIGINAKVTQRQISAFGTAGVDIIGMVSERQGIAIEKTKEWLQSISNPYEVIADAINAAGEAGGQFADVYNLMGTTIEQLTANMNDAIGTFGEATMKLTGFDEQVKGALRSLSSFFNIFEHPENVATVAGSIKKLFGEFNAGSVVTNVLNGITKALAAFNSGQFDNMIIFFKQFFGVLKQFAGVSIIGRSIKMILDLFSDNHTAAEVRKIATQLATLLKVIWEFRLIGKITSVFTSFARIAVQAFTSVRTAAFTMLGVVASILGVFNSGGDIFGGLFKGVSDVVADVGKKSSDEANKSGKSIMKNIGDGAESEAESTKKKIQDIYEELAKLQAQWVKEMGDMGAFDLKEQLAWYQKFQAEYAVGTKARISMDEKVHDAELAISKDIISKVDEFNEVFNKAMKTAKDYYDMFEYTQVTLRRTAESVIEGLRRQNDNMLKYYQNLKKMSEMGFDADFMQYVYDSGMDAASEVAGLANATQEQIDEINEMWKTRGQIATDIAVLNTQQLKEETLSEIADLQSSLDTQVVDVYDSGTLLVRSFTEGIMDYLPTIEDAMTNVAATASNAASGGVGETGDFGWDWEDLMNYDDYEGLLDRMNVDAFEYGDAMGMLGEFLKQNWAIMLPGIISFMSIVKNEIFGVKKNAVDSINETTKEIKNGVNSAKGSMVALINEIQKVYNCMWQIENYKSVYNTAMDNVLGTTDATAQEVIRLIDYTKGQYSTLPSELKVSTKEATAAIADITNNGLTNISDTTRATLDKVQEACNVTIGTTESAATQSLEVIDYAARDTYDAIVNGVSQASDASNQAWGVLAETTKANFDGVTKTIDASMDNLKYSVENTATEASMKIAGIEEQVAKAARVSIDEVDQAYSKTTNDLANTLTIANRTIEKASDATRLEIDGVEQAIEKATTKAKKTRKKAVDDAQLSLFDATTKIEAEVNDTAVKTEAAVKKAAQAVKTETKTIEATATQSAQTIEDQINSHFSASQQSMLETLYTQGNGVETSLNSVGTAFQSLGTTIDSVVPGAGTALAGLGDAASRAGDMIGNNAVTKVGDALRNIKGMFGKAKTQVPTVLSEDFGQPAQAGLDKIKNLFKKTSDESATELGEAPVKAAAKVKGNTNVVVQAFQKVTTTISGIVNSIVDIFFDIADNLVERVARLVEKLFGGIGKGLAALLKPLSNAKMLIGAAVITALSTNIWLLCDSIAKVGKQETDLLKGIGGIVAAEAAILVMAALMGNGYITIIAGIGAINSTLFTVMAANMAITIECLEHAQEHSKNLTSAAFKKLQQVIEALANINFGGFWNGFKNSLKSVNLAETAAALDAMITHIKNACDTLEEFKKTYEGVDVQADVKVITDIAEDLSSGIEDIKGTPWYKANAVKSTAVLSAPMADIINGVTDSVKKLEDFYAVYGPKSDTDWENYIKTINTIVSKFGDVGKENAIKQLDPNFSFNAVGQQSKNVESIKTMATNIREIIDSVVDIEKKFQDPDTLAAMNSFKAAPKVPYATGSKPNGKIDTINSVLVNLSYIGSTLFSDGSIVLDKQSEAVTKIKDMSGNVSEIIKNVKAIADELAKFSADYITGGKIDEDIKAVNSIIAKICGTKGKDENGNDTHVGGFQIPESYSGDDASKFDNISKTITSLSTIIKTISETDPAGAVNNITGFEKVVEFIKTTMTGLPTVLATYTDDFLKQGESYAQSFVNGWNNKLGEGATAGHDMQNAVWSAIEEKMSDEYSQGETFAGQLLKGISDKTKASAYEAGHSFQSAVWLGIQDRMGDMYNQGDAIAGNEVSGLVNGIKSRLPQIANSSINLGETAINKLRDILRIKSPSRVMAEIGGYVSEGFAEGIIDGIGAVSDAGESLAEAVMGGYDSAIEPLSTSAVEARAWTDYEKGNAGAVAGGGHTANIVQNNNIYSQLDMDTAMNDLAWAVARS